MKALWKGNLSLALLSIPVKLYPAVRRKAFRLHLLHNLCSTPLKYERYCPDCQRDVEWSEVIHGYEFEKGKFVTLTDEELESVYSEEAKTIKILSFHNLTEVDPIFFESTYYLAPEEGGVEPYILLRNVMEKTEKVGLVKLIIRAKEHIGLLRPFQQVLAVHTLHYQNEIAMPDFIEIPEKITFDKKTLSLAERLIKDYVSAFSINRYHDRQAELLMDLINKKIAGEEIKVKPALETRKVINLMEALRKSVAATAKKRGRKKAV